MRSDVLHLLDLKNADHRARWTRLYFSGSFCDDTRTPTEREMFERWYRQRVEAAWKFLRGES